MSTHGITDLKIVIYSDNSILYSREKGSLLHVATWINHKNIMLNEMYLLYDSVYKKENETNLW